MDNEKDQDAAYIVHVTRGLMMTAMFEYEPTLSLFIYFIRLCDIQLLSSHTIRDTQPYRLCFCSKFHAIELLHVISLGLVACMGWLYRALWR